ncbi:hypothetical protein MU516_16965 [Paracoccus sp. YLB-12]|uniref:Uncharacterized protein n=1 Tax=Paracoccus maritimus TaxID=2933292 RepID=A0ABT2KDC3_9RHOB|nr:hypothetical protein [Paracoccus sp. YLB-12]MCT4334548.1 hypothetical protein [Paracoccus sp. YLB-12]
MSTKERLEKLKKSRPALPDTGFITRLPDKPKDSPRADNTVPSEPQAKPPSDEPKQKAAPVAEDVAGTQISSPPPNEPKNRSGAAIVSPPEPALEKQLLQFVLKVPKSQAEQLAALAAQARLEQQRVLKSLGKDFIPAFREAVAKGRPSATHLEPFQDNIPRLYFRTTLTLQLSDVSHIDPMNLVGAKEIFENWAQWEFAKFLETRIKELLTR